LPIIIYLRATYEIHNIYNIIVIPRNRGRGIYSFFLTGVIIVYPHIPPDTGHQRNRTVFGRVMNYYVLRRETPTEFNKTVKLSADRK